MDRGAWRAPVHRVAESDTPVLYVCVSAVLSRPLVSNSFDPSDCSPPGFSVHGVSPRKNTGVGSLSLLRGILPTQGSNSALPHCRWILYQLSHKGSPRILEWVA